MIILERLLKTKKPSPRIPIWFMRQAGRFLPEYRGLRRKHPSFLDFCQNPKDASEATLQPLRRFDLDAAIIFSDILVIPSALGQKVEFLTGEGPKLNPITSEQELSALNFNQFEKRLQATPEAISLTRQALPKEKALIGFAGAPWTVACYMIQGGGSKNFDEARLIIAKDPVFFDKLMMMLLEATALYLIAQAKAGADVLKLFDSWAGLCPAWLTDRALIKPVKQIIERVREDCPQIPILYFPRGSGEKVLSLGRSVKADGVALDHFIDPLFVRDTYSHGAPLALQGGLDPLVMAAGGALLEKEVYRYLEAFKGLPYIFNLGHGMIPSMPIDHVTRTISYVRAWEKENLRIAM
ncbi:MAG: uroporphyrinogen decarboxylase [Alphaproteobacteria bacterium]|nr:uroporphyrinogen decarboxylase [Alphaproteobacteria bacterium]